MEEPCTLIPHSLIGHRYASEFTITDIGPPAESGPGDRMAILLLRGESFLLSFSELKTLIESGLFERRS